MKTIKLLLVGILTMVVMPGFAQQTANVQIIHNSPDQAVDTVDVYVNGSLAVPDLAFREATPFTNLPANTQIDVAIAPNNTSINQSVDTFTFNLNANQNYVIVANGIPSSSGYNPNKPFDLDVYANAQTSALSGSGNTDMLVNHGSTDAGPVDVTQGGTTVIDNLQYGQFDGYLFLPAIQDYVVTVQDSTGTTTIGSYELNLSSNNLGDSAVTLLASGFKDPAQNSNGPSFGLYMATPSGGPLMKLPETQQESAQAQIIHNSADAAADTVDIYVNGVLEIQDLAFQEATPYLDLPANTPINVAIAPNNSSIANSVDTFNFNLTANETYSIVANGIASTSGYTPNKDFTLDVRAMARQSANASGNTDILVNHGATDAPTVDIVETKVGAGTLVDNLAYGDFAGYLSVAGNNDYVLEVRDSTGTNTVGKFEANVASAGLADSAITVVASGFLNPAQNSNGEEFGLHAALPEGGPLIELPEMETAEAQIIHNSADDAADTVDLYVNGNLAVEDLAFREATPYLELPANTPLDIAVAPNNTSIAQSVDTFTFNLTAYEQYSIVANGIVSNSGYNPNKDFALNAKAMARQSASTSGETDVLVNHGATDAGPVDIAAGGNTVIDNLQYGQFDGYLSLTTQNYTLAVQDSTGSNTVGYFDANLSQLNLQDSAITVVASGFVDTAQNNDGPGFGLYAALANGGPLVELSETQQPTAEAQIIHNSADDAADTVDVYVNGNLAVQDLAFREATSYLELPANTPLDIAIAPNNTSIGSSVDTFNFNLAEDEQYSIVANGIVSGSGYNPNKDFTLDVKAMARKSANTSGETDILVNHGATDAPTVDIVETKVGAGTLVDNLAYGEFAGYLSVSGSNNYLLEVRDSTGTSTVGKFEANLASAGLADAAVTVVASGFLDPSQNSNGAEFGLYAALSGGGQLVELPEVETAEAQIIHNSADDAADTVDVYVNGDLAVEDLAFREATSYLELPANTPLDIAIAPNNTSIGSSVDTFNFTLTEDEQYSIVANGIVSGSGYNPNKDFTLDTAMARKSSNTSGETDLLVNHGATDAPTVDIVETKVGAGTLVDDLAYGEFAGYLEVATDDYVLEVRDSTGSTTVGKFEANLEGLNLEDSAVTVVASGFLDPSQNSNGAEFGLYAALSDGGQLVELPKIETAEAQIIHNSADDAADLIDIYVNGDLAVDSLGFREATPYIELRANQALDIAIAPANTSIDDTVATFDFNLDADEQYVMVANGIVSSSGYDPNKPFDLDVNSMARKTANQSGNTDILINHGATDASVVDITEAGLGSLVDNLPYGEFADYKELLTDKYKLTVLDSSGTDTVGRYEAALDENNLEDSSIVVVASGFVDSSENSDGAEFGLYAALASGGDLIKLPEITSSIAERLEQTSIQVFPNPSSNRVNVQWDASQLNDLSLQIINQKGQVVRKEEQLKSSPATYNIQNLEDGVYFIQISQDGAPLNIQQLIKQ